MATLLTSQIITRETVMQVTNNLVLAQKCDWSNSGLFGKSSGKIGSTLDVRLPILTAPVINNLAYPSGATSTVVEMSVPLQVATTMTQAVTFSEQEMTLRVEDFSRRVLKQICAMIAAKFDLSIFDAISNAGINYFANASVPLGNMSTAKQYSGVAGWVVSDFNTTLTSDIILSAKQLLDDNACPDDGEIYGVLSPKASRQLTSAQLTLFNAQKQISDIYLKGRMGEFAGIEWAMSQNCASHTNGAVASITVSGGQSQSTWSDTATLTVSSTSGILAAGDVFTSAGCYKVNPLTKAPTTTLQQFTVVGTNTAAATVAGSGGTNNGFAASATQVIVSPAPITSGPYQNVSTAIGSTLSLVGSAGAGGQESVLFHRSAIQIAAPELEKPDNMESAFERDDDTGVAIRYLATYDAIGAAPGASGVPGWIRRFDVLYGCRIVRPEWVVRIRN